MKIYISRDRKFYQRLLALTLPIAGQNLIIYALNMLDTIMLGKLGESQIAAAGLANQPFFVFTLFLFGISSGSSILVSQYYGKGDKKSVSKVMMYALLLSAVLSAVFMIAVLLFPRQTMGIFSSDESVISMGVQYLRIVAPSYILTAISTTYLSVVRATEDVHLPLKINTLALSLNAVLNYILIFGKLGLPKMGVSGAALATLISRMVECGIVVYLMANHREKVALKWQYIFHMDKPLLRDFFHYATPVIINETLWGLGVSVYSIILGHMGTSVVAAYNVAQVFEKFASVAMMGVANATVIILGQQLGQGNTEEAEKSAHSLLTVSVGLGVICGGFLLGINSFVFRLYNISPDAIATAQQILTVIASVMIFKAFNYTSIVGVIRSGGDAKCSLILDITGMWVIGIPLGFLLWKLGMPAYGVYIGFMMDEVYKFFAGIWRIKSRKWIRNITRDA